MSLNRNAELRRLLLYGVVGTANTLVCYALYVALLKLLHWNYNLALVADYGFGIVLGYALHRFSTFADRTHIRGAFGNYTVTLISCFFVNLVLLDAMVRMQWLDAISASRGHDRRSLIQLHAAKTLGLSLARPAPNRRQSRMGLRHQAQSCLTAVPAD